MQKEKNHSRYFHEILKFIRKNCDKQLFRFQMPIEAKKHLKACAELYESEGYQFDFMCPRILNSDKYTDVVVWIPVTPPDFLHPAEVKE